MAAHLGTRIAHSASLKPVPSPCRPWPQGLSLARRPGDPDIANGMTSKHISIRGAREHNLKNISLDLPRERLVVITGLSGSGKSSLAFDTIYAEGQRRYVKSLSAYARQFLDMMQKPDVDHIDGLSPAIAIEQKTTSRNPRSTVGTVTEIYDYMRLLWARVGVPYSPATGLPIESQTVSQMVDRVLALPEGTRLYLLAPIARGRKGEYKKDFAELQKKGFQRVKVDGQFYEIAEAPSLDKKIKHDIDVVVDRVVVRPDMAARLADSFETALQLADGVVIAEFADRPPERIIFSAKFACPVSGFTIEEIEPRLFSFNNPYGACPECDGLGTELFFEPDLVVPDESLSLARGAIAPWTRTSASSPYYQQTLEALARAYRQPMTKPWKSLPEAFRNVVLYGSGEDEITFTYDDGVRHYSTTKPFEGVIPNIERRWRETKSSWVTEELSRYQSDQYCEACKGYRLKPQALAVKIAGLHIGEVADMSIRAAHAWFEALPAALTPKQNEIAGRILKEIRERLNFLNDVGLEYLTLARASGTLSGGESQRIRLASQIGSGLTGVLYVLDEPSIGLHQRDNARLLETLKALRDLGNSVLVVEHDEEAILTADYVVDMGPGAGIHGGAVVAEGTPERGDGQSGEPDGAISHRLQADPRPQGAAQADPRPAPVGDRRARQQPQRHHRGYSARPVHHRHRRVGRRQIHLPRRDALSRRGAQILGLTRNAGRARRDRRLGAARQGDRHRPIADRPHAAHQPRHLYRHFQPHPRIVRRAARGQDARLRARALLLQRQRRALRGVPGRRRDQDRDALPARRLCDLRRVQGQALRPRDAGDQVQRQIHRRRARHDGGGGGRAVQGGAVRARQAAHAGARRTRLHPCRPAGDHALRRRGAAHQAVQGAVAARHRAARSIFSTSRPPACISTTWPSCSRCCSSWSTRATRW